MLTPNGFQAMITMHSWMFLTSFEKLRYKINAKMISSMAHLGARAFEEISGEIVQTVSFVNSIVIAAIEGDALGNASVNKSVKLSTSYDSNAVSPAVAATSANILDGFVSVFATFTNDLRDIFSGISISAGSGTTIAGAKNVNIKMGDITISGVVDKDSKEIVREIADEQVKELSDEIADVLNHS